MVGEVAYQRDCKVITESSVDQIRLALRALQFELLASLEDLEDQFLIVTALLACQVRYILYTGRLNGLESEFRICLVS